MDTETLVSPSQPKAPITILNPQENDGDDGDPSSHIGEEDDFETASESDSDEPLAVKATPLLSKASMPKAKVTGDYEFDDNPSPEDEEEEEEGDDDGPGGKDEILGGRPVTVVKVNGNSEDFGEEDGVDSATEDGGKAEDLGDNIDSHVTVVPTVVEEPLGDKGEIFGGEAEVKKEGVAETLVAAGGIGETQEQSSVEMEAVEGVSNVAGTEENVSAELDGVMEELEIVKKEVDEAVEIKTVNGAEENEAADLHAVVEEPKEVDIEHDEVEVEKDDVGEFHAAMGEPKAIDGELEAVEGESNVDEVEPNMVVESHAAVEEPKAMGRELDENVEEESIVYEAEAAELHASVEEQKAVEKELDENVEEESSVYEAKENEEAEVHASVEEPKAVDRELDENGESSVSEVKENEAADLHALLEEPKAVDKELNENGEGDSSVSEVKENVAVDLHAVLEEPKAVAIELDENGEGESSASELKEDKVADLHASVEEPKIVEREIYVVEPENVGAVADAATAGQSLEMETMEVKDVPVSYQGPADSETKPEEMEVVPISADDSKCEEREGEVSETSALPGSYQAPTDSEARPDDVGSFPMQAEDSESKEIEEVLVTPGMSKNDDTRVSGEILSSLSVDQKVEADAGASEAVDDDENQGLDDTEDDDDDDDTVSDQAPRVAILDSSGTAKQIIKEMEEGSSSTSSVSGFESSRDFPHQVDGRIVSDSDEEVDTDEEGDDKELFDSAALAALLKAATGGSSDGNITITSQDGTRVFSVDRPAGLGNSAPVLRPGPTRSTRPNLFNSSELAVSREPETDMDEEEKKLRDKVNAIRVKFLRLVMRLGHSPEDTVAAQVLYRLGLAEGIKRGRQTGRGFTIETAKKKASDLESEGKELEFSCNILVLGKIGVGKSATINSIFGEKKCNVSAFLQGTTSVREISGVVDGVKIRVVDTPGLRSSVMDQAANRKILSSIKSYMKSCPPDIVLYVDRMDTQTRDFNDLPLLKSITSTLGSSVWFNAIIALTHAASAPPDGPSGSPLGYDTFIDQRSRIVQHSIRQSTGDMRLMNPVALVENHPSCRRNREGQKVLPNGLSWRPQMLLLCYSSKILSEANALLKLQDSSPAKLFSNFRYRSPPLPYLLSTLLQTRQHPKLSNDQGGDNGDSDIDLDDFSDSDEEGDEYDQLPPFKPLKKAQIAKLTTDQKKAYFDEYDYRVKLLQKKQWKQELRRMKEMKKRGKSGGDEAAYGDMAEDYDQDGAPAAVPVPLPDMVLPPSFDCDVPTYRYRFLEPNSQLLTRPVLDTHGWDHDCGYDGVSLEESLAIAGQFPATVAVQITKDKKEFNIHLDSSVSAKHGENGSSLAGFDIQTVGKQLAYILRSETRFKNLKKNKTTAGISVTFLGETVATGLKIEDQLSIGKRVGLVASTGAIRSQGDMAYGANLEARLREKDYPIGQALSTLGLSLMKWRNDLALGGNLQSQLSIGRDSKVAVRVGINNKLSGQITVKTSSSEQLQLALVGILPLAVSFLRSLWSGESYLVD